MSQENVEIVRRAYEVFNRREGESALDLYARDIEWDLSRAMLGTGEVYRGHEGVRESFRDLLTAFAAIDFEIERYEGFGEQVLATVRERYRGRGSGIEVDRRHFALWTVRAGKVARMRVYRERAEALEAVGLSE